MIFLSKCFWSSCIYWSLCILQNLNHKFCYHCCFYLSFFEERKIFCVKKKQKIAMNILKLILTITSVLKSLNYFFLIERIILTINFNLKKWNVILLQVNFEIDKRHFFRYENGLWIKSKSRYNTIKRECRDFLKTLKKVCFWLYKMQFIIKIDANILMTQFNCSAANFSKVLIIH